MSLLMADSGAAESTANFALVLICLGMHFEMTNTIELLDSLLARYDTRPQLASPAQLV